MKLILVEDVKKLGAAGDIVDVKRGYARNFLLPGKLAIECDKQNIHALEAIKRRREQRLEREKQEMRALADRISALSCTIAVSAGEEDRLFGSVTAAEIADAYKVEGVELDRKQIELDAPIKKLGVYQISVRLGPDVTAGAKVWIVKK